jgi:hypothetical protein
MLRTNIGNRACANLTHNHGEFGVQHFQDPFFENDQADIFPDDGGRQMFDVWNNDYRDLEAMVNQMHHAA